jgi:hypothetical protein
MATIGNQSNSQNEEKKTLSSGAAPAYIGSGSSKQGSQQSGQFTGLRQFLAANKQAGQQLAGQITGQGEKLRETTKSGISSLEGATKQATDTSKDIIEAGSVVESGIKAPAQAVPVVQSQPAAQQAPLTTTRNKWGSVNFANQTAAFGPQAPVPTVTQQVPGAEQFVKSGSKEEGLAKTALQGSMSATKDLETKVQKAALESASSASKLSEYGKKLQSEEGRGALLQNLLNPKGAYVGGKSVLDQAFLQRGGQQQLQQAMQQTKSETPQLQAKVQTTQQAAQTSVAALGSTAEDVRNKLLGTISSTGETLRKAASEEASKKTQAAQEDFNIMSGYLGGTDPATMSASQQGRLTQLLGEQGLTRGMQTYGLKAADFLTPGQLSVSAEQAMTPQQIAQINALNQLAGSSERVSEQTPIGPAMALSPEFKKQAEDKAKSYMSNFQPVQASKMDAEKRITELTNFKNEYESSNRNTEGKNLQAAYAEQYQLNPTTPAEFERIAQAVEKSGNTVDAAKLRERARYLFINEPIQAEQAKISEQNAKIAELNRLYNVDSRLK